MIGFDGFIDAIIAAVDRRHDMSAEGYTAFRTITDFADRVGAAAGKSTNIELIVKEERFGGNGPLLASAVARLGMPTTYVGAVGADHDARSLNPIFEPFAARCKDVIPIARPARTDALEFEDGKVMLGKTANVQAVTWETIVAVMGIDRITQLVDESALLGVVNWTMLGGVGSIWEGLCRDVLSKRPDRGRSGSRGAGKSVLIDLADPAKRTDGDIRDALSQLKSMNALVPVILGLNLSEAERIAQVVGVSAFAGVSGRPTGAVVEKAAVELRAATGLSCVVIHPREGAAAADDSGAHGWIDGPFTKTPKLSTGAGDHFNGGFAFAMSHGLTLEESLAAGVGVSGAYVRDAESPTRARLVEFLMVLPGPEGE